MIAVGPACSSTTVFYGVAQRRAAGDLAQRLLERVAVERAQFDAVPADERRAVRPGVAASPAQPMATAFTPPENPA